MAKNILSVNPVYTVWIYDTKSKATCLHKIIFYWKMDDSPRMFRFYLKFVYFF